MYMAKIMLILVATVMFLVVSAAAIAVAGIQDRKAVSARKHSKNRNREYLQKVG